MEKKDKDDKPKGGDDMKKLDRMAWEIVKLPDGNYKWMWVKI